MFISNLDPVFFRIGSLEMRYYSLLWAIGILLVFLFLVYFSEKKRLHLDTFEIMELVIWGCIGMLIFTRIFYAIFYNFDYFYANPLKIFAIWEGGISIYGSFFGAALGLFLYCRFYKKDFFEITDFTLIPAALVLFFGRFGNLFNSELYGRITNVPWAFNFNHEVDNAGNLVFRHPSQIYEAGKNLFIFSVLWVVKDKNMKKGTISCLFFLMYSSLRFFIEFYRAPDPQMGFVLLGLTMGQILSIMMFLIGLIVLMTIYKDELISYMSSWSKKKLDS